VRATEAAAAVPAAVAVRHVAQTVAWGNGATTAGAAAMPDVPDQSTDRDGASAATPAADRWWRAGLAELQAERL